jgi:hypothetical protein
VLSFLNELTRHEQETLGYAPFSLQQTPSASAGENIEINGVAWGAASDIDITASLDYIFPVMTNVPEELQQYFSCYSLVFGVHVFSTAATASWVHQHVARSLAKFLDQVVTANSKVHYNFVYIESTYIL